MRCRRFSLGLRRLGFLQCQLELLENPLDPLRARTELLALELGDLGFQLLDRQLRDDEAVLGRGKLGDAGGKLGIFHEQQPLQLGDVIWQLFGRERHGRDLSASRDAAAESRGRSPQIAWRSRCRRMHPRRHPASVGCHVGRGARQSSPSSSIDICAGVSVTEPSFVVGHVNQPSPVAWRTGRSPDRPSPES